MVQQIMFAGASTGSEKLLLSSPKLDQEDRPPVCRVPSVRKELCFHRSGTIHFIALYLNVE